MAEANIQAASFTPQEFSRVVVLAIRAGQGEWSGAHGATGTADDPYARAALALRELFADQPARFDAALTRFSALMHLFTGDRLGPWVRVSAGNPQAKDIHPAVVHVAAQMRLKRNGRFPERRFLEAVEQFAKEFSERDDPPAGHVNGS